jgi:DNA-binding transcriptional LysR family regulator
VLRRYATQLLALRSEAESDLRAEEVGSAGHLAIAASTIPGEYLLPPVLARLRQTHVGLALTVEVSDTGRALEAVLGGRCELALVGSQTKDRRLELYPFAEDEIILIGPAHNRFELPGPGDLRGIPIIVRGEGSGTRMAVADVFARSVGGEGPGPMVEVGSTEAVKQCVLAGLGLAFVSKVAVADELAQGRLREVALEGLPVHRRFHAATRRSATLSSGAEALLELLVPGRNLPV